MSEEVSVLVSGRITAGLRDYMLKFLRRMAQEARQHTGCHYYEISQSLEDPDVVIAWSRWRSRADFEAHNQTPLIQEFKKHLMDQQFVEQAPKTFWRPLE